jgi:hypothetical protein
VSNNLSTYNKTLTNYELLAIWKKQVMCYLKIFIIIFSGSAAQRGLWPPVALQPTAGYGLFVTRGFVITNNDAPQSVGLLLDE